MKSKWVSFIVTVVCFPIVWSLFDYLYYTLIDKEAFQFKIVGDLILPLIVGAFVGYFTYIYKKRNKKEDQ